MKVASNIGSAPRAKRGLDDIQVSHLKMRKDRRKQEK